jgi:hypothetical protein
MIDWDDIVAKCFGCSARPSNHGRVSASLGMLLFTDFQSFQQVALTRKSLPTSYFGSLAKWYPIMQKYEAGQDSNYSTSPVQLIMSLHTSLSQFSIFFLYLKSRTCLASQSML